MAAENFRQTALHLAMQRRAEMLGPCSTNAGELAYGAAKQKLTAFLGRHLSAMTGAGRVIPGGKLRGAMLHAIKPTYVLLIDCQ
jgi:hypothetical protein